MADDPTKTDSKPAEQPPVETSKPTHPLDEVLKDVEAASSVHDGVKLLVEKLADEFASPELQERAEAFADAVKANASELSKSNTPDTPFQAPAPATEEDVAALEARNHAAPHNEAAAAAVDAGMDTKTANEMTKVGSNI